MDLYMLDKIITIIIVTIVLLAIEYGTYFLLKKFIKEDNYNYGHFEDAHIYGLAIIAVIDLTIWYGDKVWS